MEDRWQDAAVFTTAVVQRQSARRKTEALRRAGLALTLSAMALWAAEWSLEHAFSSRERPPVIAPGRIAYARTTHRPAPEISLTPVTIER